MNMPKQFPRTKAGRLEYARRIATKHMQLDAEGQAACMARIQQEHPCLARLVRALMKGDEGCGA